MNLSLIMHQDDLRYSHFTRKGTISFLVQVLPSCASFVNFEVDYLLSLLEVAYFCFYFAVDSAVGEYWYVNISILGSKSVRKGAGQSAASSRGLVRMFLYGCVPYVRLDMGLTLDFFMR